MRQIEKTLLLAACSCLFIAGCTKEAQDKYSEAGSQASAAAKTAGEAVSADAKVAAPKVKAAMDEAGKKLAEATEDSKKAAAQSLMTGKVKQALLAAEGLDTSHLDVSTTGKTVTLSGSVPSKDQKRQAEMIAKGIVGDDFILLDELAVK